MRIKNIVPSVMPIPIGPVVPHHYAIAQGYMHETHGIILPSKKEMNFDNDYLQRLCDGRFEIKVWWENNYLWWWKFRPGFFTDLGSVPKFLRIAIDNDDPRLTIPAILHDDLFQRMILDRIYGDGVGFLQANALLKEALRWYGLAPFMCNRVYDAVSTPIGKKSYQERHPRQSTNNNLFAILSPEQQKSYDGDESIFN